MAKPDEAAIMTLIANGLKDTPSAVAALRAMGMQMAAAALLVTISVRARAMKYKRQFADLPVLLGGRGFNTRPYG